MGADRIHFQLWGAGYPRQWAEELRFAGTPFVSEEMVATSQERGRFGGVRPLSRDPDGTWRCTFDIRLKGESNF